MRIRADHIRVNAIRPRETTSLDVPINEGESFDVEISGEAWEWVQHALEGYQRAQQFLLNRICLQHGHVVLQRHSGHCERCGGIG